jgi:hypothetical protein
VAGRHKNDCAANKVSNQVSLASRKLKTPMFGASNTTTLPVIAKQSKRVPLFVSRFSPEVTS